VAEDLVGRERCTRVPLAFPDALDERNRIRATSQLDELASQVLLEGPSSACGTGRELVPRVVGNVTYGDRWHTCSMLLPLSMCKQNPARPVEGVPVSEPVDTAEQQDQRGGHAGHEDRYRDPRTGAR
jgi:hypothetical protein